MSAPSSSITNDDPLPLSQLRLWMSEEVHDWIQEGDIKQAELQKELEENAAENVANFFGSESDSDDESNQRVQQWSSSTFNVDGIGGFQSSTRSDENDNDKEDGVKVFFILSESYKGFGDTLWSSARHVANLIANPKECREMLLPMLSQNETEGKEIDNDEILPLDGVSFLELGAGAGLPSWSAMQVGARVVCTDLSDTNRIRTMGECAERNGQQMRANGKLLHGEKTKVCPHDWGTNADDVLRALNENGQEKFDFIVAADCCYMPWLHKELLDSIYQLLSDKGVSLVAFALHGNTDDDDVWKIVDRAKDRGFMVEVLESQQLSPPNSDMESKQGLVHRIRLMKQI